MGHLLRIDIAFNFVEGGKAGRAARQGATATQLADDNARLAAEQAVAGRPDAWRDVYNVLRCDGPPCILLARFDGGKQALQAPEPPAESLSALKITRW